MLDKSPNDREKLKSTNGQSPEEKSGLYLYDEKAAPEIKSLVADALAKREKGEKGERGERGENGTKAEKYSGMDYQAISDDFSVYEAPLATKLIPPKPRLSMILRQLSRWIWAISYFVSGTFADMLRKRDNEERRAERLRLAFEKAGGTLVKIGQQMSIRYDLLPHRYCAELAQMLDSMPAFPTEEAIRIIETDNHCSIDEIFSEFNPVPVGSASIACVYKARLRATGQEVAVKVQRPHIQDIFVADFAVIDILLGIIEWFGLLRAEYTKNVRSEFRYALFLELDFRREARCQIIFRKAARKLKKHISAPEVYFELSTERVIIQEFVEGIQLSEVLAILKRPTAQGIQTLERWQINPKQIARRLLYANYWGMYHNLIFHADPHPANIIIRENNELVFIDFGACGVFDKARRILYRQLFMSQVNDDSWGMVQAILSLLEPLPAIDINELARDFQAALVENLIIFKSNKGAWYEKTSAQLWLSFLGLIGKFGISAPKDILLFARGSLLYDSLAAQLDSDINFFKEFRRYARDVGRKAGKEYRKGISERAQNGLKPDDYLVVQQAVRIGQQALFRLDRALSVPYDFAVLPFVIEKSVFAVLRFIHFLYEAFLISLVGIGIYLVWRYYQQQEITVNLESLLALISHPAYLIIIGIILVRHIRQVIFRLNDKTHLNLHK